MTSRIEFMDRSADWLEDQIFHGIPAPTEGNTHLYEPMAYALRGGRRLRPRLVMAVVYACLPQPDHDALDLARRAALALEFVHCAALVHHDLPAFHNLSARRGQPATHAKYGVPLALLTGDALYTLAYQTLSDYDGRLFERAHRLVRLLCEASGSKRGLLRGQTAEALANVAVDIDTMNAYHRHRTGRLFGLAARAGAEASGQPLESLQQWEDLGVDLGVAYHLLEDQRMALGPNAERTTEVCPVCPTVRGMHDRRTTNLTVNALIDHVRQRAARIGGDPSTIIDLLSGPRFSHSVQQ